MKQSQYVFAILLFVLLLPACGGEATPPTEADIPPTSTFTPVPPTPTPIVHTMVPGQPIYLLAQLISDCTIGNGVTVGATVDDPVILSTGCDRWDYNKIERPFEDTFTNYAPQSDISLAQIGYDDTWFFAQAITYFGEVVEPQPMNGTYGIELDRNLDGRGDILILATKPGEEWDVTGVQVWRDNDTTVGADTPVMADEDNPNGGYDEMIFDSGMGDDPDLAWARISPDDPNVVQIAFKRSLGGEPGKERFNWLMWAGLIEFAPLDFDYVDTFPGNELYEVDNTCSWTYGVPLQGLPNQCGFKVEEDTGCPDVSSKPPAEDCYEGVKGHWEWNENICEWVCVKGLP